MIYPPRKPYSEKLTLVGCALFESYIADSRVVQLRMEKIIEVRLDGHRYGSPRITIPREVFIAAWNTDPPFDQEQVSRTDELTERQANDFRDWIKGSRCKVRVSHYKWPRKPDFWMYEVVEID